MRDFSHSVSEQEPSKMAAIVVPLSTIPTLTDEEQISFRHLNHYLGKYDIYLLAPQSLQIQFPTENAAIKRFPNKYFGSVKAHAKLLFSPMFYQTFSHKGTDG